MLVHPRPELCAQYHRDRHENNVHLRLVKHDAVYNLVRLAQRLARFITV